MHNGDYSHEVTEQKVQEHRHTLRTHRESDLVVLGKVIKGEGASG
jgi:hypothetical protein